MSDTHQLFVNHLLRRTHFGVSRSQIEMAMPLDRDELLRLWVDEAESPRFPARPGLINRERQSYADFLKLVKTELQRLSSSKSGLGDRMLWFWHSLITTSFEKVNFPGLIWRQHQMMAKHAMGSFRDLLIAICTDPAMLIYLDGDGSTGTDPNENYARELLELFSMGRGHYSQNDVAAAAKALSGWYLQGIPDNPRRRYAPGRVKAVFSSEDAWSQPVEFLGHSAQYGVNELVERILQHEATALYIVRQLFNSFVHDKPTQTVLEELAAVFRDADYQIRPLLQALFRHPEFTSAQALAGRARLPLEWFMAVKTATGLALKHLDFESYLDASGQMPFAPANVAGWRVGVRWLSAPCAMARQGVCLQVLELNGRQRIIDSIADADDPIAETLAWLSLMEISNLTRQQLQTAVQQVTDRTDQARLLLSLALAAPEFAIT